MPVLILDYRHCDRKRPKFIKHVEIENIAALARQQLVATNTDAIPFETLRQIDSLKINGTDFVLEVSTDYEVHDEHGNHVFGICEYDPGVPDTAMVSVSPVGEKFSELLALSTLAHELGHAVFDAPGWIVEGSRGAGLFGALEPSVQRTCRTTTPDSEHLAKSPTAGKGTLASDEHFAELRANEFMGSLLVPRRLLNAAAEELAPQHGVTLHRSLSLDPDMPGTSLHLTADGTTGTVRMESLERALATRFGVNRRFVQVRMQRYGLIRQEAAVR